MSRLGRALTLSPPKIAGGYLLFGGLWILLSDRLVAEVAETQLLATRLQTIKGWLFVLGSAAVILALTRTRERQVETSRDRLATATQELQVLHRIYRHNIRNDLNVIQGHVDLVRETLSPGDERDQLATVSTTADRIVAMSEKLRAIEQADLRTDVDASSDIPAPNSSTSESSRSSMVRPSSSSNPSLSPRPRSATPAESPSAVGHDHPAADQPVTGR